MQRRFTAGHAAFKVIVTGEPLAFYVEARKGQARLWFYLACTITQLEGCNICISTHILEKWLNEIIIWNSKIKKKKKINKHLELLIYFIPDIS